MADLPAWQPAAADAGHSYYRTERLRVPGGWLYRLSYSGGANSCALVFVPDDEGGGRKDSEE